MNAPVETAGAKPRVSPAGGGRLRANTFSWWPVVNISTREPVRARGVSRGWRALLVETLT
jgi:hypothetical protein